MVSTKSSWCEKQKAYSTRMKGMKGITAEKRFCLFFHPLYLLHCMFPPGTSTVHFVAANGLTVV
jgi:hypothetical protein